MAMLKTAAYAALHMLVDGVCAFAMAGRLTAGNDSAAAFLIYNFCAFALQMPFGALLDMMREKYSARIFPVCAALGCVFTLLGAFVHPAVLGIGNALFHVGGGVEVIGTDRAEAKRGSLLGIFVAPGALGLFLGAQAAKEGNGLWFFIFSAVLMAALSVLTFRGKVQMAANASGMEKQNEKSALLLAAGCVAAVILRSYVGLAVAFPWKTTAEAAFVSVLAVVFGKMAGGILAAAFGKRKVVLLSLLAAALFYFFSDNLIAGAAALFCFNMTMPVTLHMLTEKFPEFPGFVFGLLTFALFLGFLPVAFGAQGIGKTTGTAGSIISAAILIFALKYGKGD